MIVVPLYASILGLVFVGLSVRTLLLRRKKRIGIGTADDPEMTRAMRVHANFAEYTPLTLLILFFLEHSGGSAVLLHVLCGALVAGRVVHAYGVSQVKENYKFRVAGMALTFVALISGSGRLMFAYIA